MRLPSWFVDALVVDIAVACRLHVQLIEACVTKLARSPNGTDVVSKFLSSNPNAATLLVSALLPEVPCLASHPYGAGVVSELFCHCQDLKLGPSVIALSNCLKGSLLRLTKDRFGCRVIQAALREALPEFQQAFISELKGQVLSLCQHLHANFVLQKCIELMEPRVGVFLIAELRDHAVSRYPSSTLLPFVFWGSPY